jgi:pyridoxal phosphate enzyme (YggS family)
MTVASIVAANYTRLRDRIDRACARADRSPADVKLVAVVKYAQLEWVRALVALGVNDFGESRPQQLVERAGLLGGDVRWHLIGHLQRNKARRVLPLVSLIHSVDSLRLLGDLERLAGELQLRPRVLLEVNLGCEATKSGFAADELRAGWETVLACRRVEVQGLMTMAPWAEDPQTVRPVFAALRDLRDELAHRSPPEVALPELSMGMSSDFESAIQEGATTIRIGSLLFEDLS